MAVFQRSSQGKEQTKNTKTIELLKIRLRYFEDLCYESYQYLALSSPSYQVLWDWIREAWFNWWNQAQGKGIFQIRIVWICFLLRTFLVQQVATPSVVKRIIRLKTDSPGGKDNSCIPWPDPDLVPQGCLLGRSGSSCSPRGCVTPPPSPPSPPSTGSSGNSTSYFCILHLAVPAETYEGVCLRNAGHIVNEPECPGQPGMPWFSVYHQKERKIQGTCKL